MVERVSIRESYQVEAEGSRKLVAVGVGRREAVNRPGVVRCVVCGRWSGACEVYLQLRMRGERLAEASRQEIPGRCRVGMLELR